MLITATNLKAGKVETRTDKEWSKITGIAPETIRLRVTQLKWTTDEAVSLPPHTKRNIKPKPKKTKKQIFDESFRLFVFRTPIQG